MPVWESYLWEQLIRADHHLIYLDSLNDTRSRIRDTLPKAEREIHTIMIKHYRDLVEEISEILEAVEERINGIVDHPDSSAAIHNFLQVQHNAMEREENSLRTALLQHTRTLH